jgi:hypothetical protein
MQARVFRRGWCNEICFQFATGARLNWRRFPCSGLTRDGDFIDSARRRSSVSDPISIVRAANPIASIHWRQVKRRADAGGIGRGGGGDPIPDNVSFSNGVFILIRRQI